MGTISWLSATRGLRYYIDQAMPGGHQLTHLIYAHKAIAIFGVIALEEIGIPIPLPGDAFIAFAGHLIARNRLDPLSAYLAVLLGSMIGASILYWLARSFGQPFVKRYGPYMHVKMSRVDKLETWFQKWGPLVVIIGRHVPGFRIVLSVCAGLFGMSYPVFLGSVAMSASVWAGMFLMIGMRLDSQIGPYMEITPLHLVPSSLFISGSIAYALVLRHRARRAEASEPIATVQAQAV